MVNLHIRADLRCLKVFIRGQKARISEVIIEGMEAFDEEYFLIYPAHVLQLEGVECASLEGANLMFLTVSFS